MSEVLSVKEAALELGIPRTTVYAFISDGALAAYQYNARVWRIARADLEDFRNQHYTGRLLEDA
jgi:excisionase family DNA binding protein